MATPYTINVTPENTGLWRFGQTEPAAQKVSDLLQRDLKEHFVFFNQEGFHNHISHHLLALYGTGAPPSSLQKGYDDNADYQRPAGEPRPHVADELSSFENAQKYLGKEKYYPDFLLFFQREIERLGGWQPVVNEYLFKPNDPRAEDMLIRLYAGFLHPLIQLMYGVEWDQPAIVAMGLAQAAVHKDDLRKYFLAAESTSRGQMTPMPSIVSLYEAVAADDKMANSAQLDDANKIRDGVLKRAWDETVKLTSRVKLSPEELELRTAEMYNAAIYMAASAAVHGPDGKEPKFDFFLIHHVNASPFFVKFLEYDWVTPENKVRLLEWKIRLDLVQYAARGCPKLGVDKIKEYTPKEQTIGPPIELASRLHDLSDDGHAIKLFRAIGIGQQISQKYESRDGFLINSPQLWAQITYLAVDSVEVGGGDIDGKWIRGAGFAKAWEDVPLKSQRDGKDSNGNRQGQYDEKL